MSGGVGPTFSDIGLPQEEEAAYKQQDDATTTSSKTNEKTTPVPRKASGFLSFRQLNTLAVIIILSASGMVSTEDFAFVIFSFIYMYFLSEVAFPCRHPSREPNVYDPNDKTLRRYVLFAAIIGLLLPIAYMCEGIFEGDKEGIKAAAPHLFLLSSQVFMEGVAFSDRFSTPIRVFVPVFYNSRRIFTLVDWLRDELSKVESDYGGSLWRIYIGRALAVANMALWCFNLFGFLLPFYLPKAFKKYYCGFKAKD